MSFNEVFRKKQKLVLGLVAIIIIPSFVLVWGVGGSGMRGMSEGPTVAIVDGEKLSHMAFTKFRRRLWAALGGVKLYYRYREAQDVDPVSSNAPMRWSTCIAYGHIKKAREEGFAVSALEVDTFIRGMPWAKIAITNAKKEKRDEEKALRKAFKNTIKQLKLTKEEYRLGITEWLTLKKYLQVGGELSIATPYSAYCLYAQERAECFFKRIRISPDEGMKAEAAKKVIGPKKVEITDAEEKAWQERMTKFLEDNSRNPAYWTPAKWRFEYALAPFDSFGDEIEEERIKKEFEGNKAAYKGKKFEEVKEEIKAKLLEDEQRAHAVRLIQQEVDTYIARHMNEKKPVVLDEMAKDRILVDRGVKTGVSGDKAMTVEDLQKLKIFAGGSGLEKLLNGIAALDAEKRKTEIARFKTDFDSSRDIVSTDAGMFRIRLLEFVAPVARQLDWKDGSPEAKAFRQLLTDDIMKEEVKKLVKKKADDLLKMIQDGKKEGLEDFEVESVSWSSAPRDLLELRALEVGETVVQPFSKDGVSGIEILYLVDRKVPSRADFEKEPMDKRERFAHRATYSSRGSMQNLSWHPQLRHLLMVSPSPSMEMQIKEDIGKGRIKLFFEQKE